MKMTRLLATAAMLLVSLVSTVVAFIQVSSTEVVTEMVVNGSTRSVQMPQVNGTVGNFVLKRSGYVRGQIRFGTFEVRLSETGYVPESLICIVFSDSHGAYFLSDKIKEPARAIRESLPLVVAGPQEWSQVERIVHANYGTHGMLLLDRLRKGRSFLAIMFADANDVYLSRRAFRLDGPDEELRAASFETPEVFSAAEEDPKRYEQSLKIVKPRLSDRFIDLWNSPQFAKSLDVGLRYVAAITTFLFAVAFILSSGHRERLKGREDWRRVPRTRQREVTEYLRPFAGQQLALIVPDANDPEAVNYGQTLAKTITDAGWKVWLITQSQDSQPGVHFRSNDPELPALKPLLRALKKADVDAEQAVTGISTFSPDPGLVLVVGKRPRI
jgi:hypothetical protein